MIDNPDIPASSPQPPTEGGSVLAEIWRNLFPWDDLNAKGPPERWLKLGLEILPALAILAAQGPTTPKLLKARADGSLATGDVPNQFTKFGAPAIVGAGQITVVDSSIFSPGMSINLKLLVGANAGKGELQVVTNILPGGVIVLGGTTQFAYTVNDGVMALPDVGIFGQPIGVSQRKRSWDSVGFSDPGVNAQGFIQFAAVVGMRFVCNAASFTLVQTTANASGVSFEVVDGPNFGGAGTKRRWGTGTQAIIGSVDRIDQNDLAIEGTANTIMSIGMTGPGGAGSHGFVFGAAYLIGAEPV